MPTAERPATWVLTLYVSGAAPRSAAAIATIRKVCATELDGQVELRIVDVHESPREAIADQVVAVPTLVKSLPPPLRRLVGDLSDVERLRVGLDLAPNGSPDGHGPKEQTP